MDRRPCSLPKSRRSHSLAISSNLDALLEFEERHCETPGPKASSTRVHNESSSPSMLATPPSLPPPPRGHRRLKTMLTSKTEPNSPNIDGLFPLTRITKVPVKPANPYINPAPKPEDLLRKLMDNGFVTGVDEGIQTAASASSSDHQETVPRQFASNEATGRPLLSSPRSPRFDDRRLTTECQPSFSKMKALPWTLNAESTTPHPVNLTAYKPAELSDVDKRKPFMIQSGPEELSVKRNPSSRSLNMSIMSRRSSRNSHGKQKLEIKAESAASSPVTSMLDNFDSLAISAPTTTQGSPEADRHSFIDFISPTLPDSGYNRNNSFNSFDDQIKSMAESSSSKPSPEIAPTSILDSSTSHNYRQKRNESPQRFSTHFFHMNERVGLVKKSRKLARLFGQTPEAGILLHTFSESRHTTAHLPGRRHSLPLTTRTGDSEVPSPRSPISFMDLSDGDDNNSVITAISKVGRRRRFIASPSLMESISSEDQAEKERRRKRERLVKLHRFLGSQLPPSLVLGLEDPNSSLPPELPSTSSGTNGSQRKTWMRLRRSSSVAELPTSWSNESDRMRTELCSREKAINVKRAQKMEKVFGVAPPQTLYHTRHISIPSLPSSKPYIAGVDRNQNITAYTTHRSRKAARPGSTDSKEGLLTEYPYAQEYDTSWSPTTPTRTERSEVYSNYEHSLNSLHDILNRDDRASLAELHHYLTSDDHSPISPLIQISPTRERQDSVASSIKSERRHSLPASIISVSSEISLTKPKPDLTDFQLRRRRAAKLTNFFGVDYRVLIQDILESIESGLEHERKHGTLAAEEAEDLLHKLRQLTLKRPNIH